MLKINTRDIDYIESLGYYVAIHHYSRQDGGLPEFERPGRAPFAPAIHAYPPSYLIALEKIIAIEGNVVRFRHVAADIPLGETYKAAFMDRMKDKIMR